jgi:hypothetical protein
VARSFDCIVAPVAGKVVGCGCVVGARRSKAQKKMIQQTLFAQTLRLAFRIAIVWAGGFVLAVTVRSLLPDEAGFSFTSRQSTSIIPFSRVGFWTCILAALTVTALVVVRAMLADFGLRPPQ